MTDPLKTSARLAWLATLAGALVACGGGGGSTSAPAPAPAPLLAPGAPTSVVASSGNGQVSLAFVAPASDGGAAITSYRASCSLSGASFTGTAASSPVVVTGLTNGSTYTCSVAAINSVGTGAASPTVQALASAAAVVLNANIYSPDNYVAPTLPVHYDADVAAQDNTPRTPATTDRIATLGRVLFHDKALSVNDTVACATCHLQANGFSDPAQFSTGFGGGRTTAHAMRLGNVRYYRPGTMFWDKRAASVEEQAGGPIQSSVEMGFDSAHGGLPALETKLAQRAHYPELFKAAFGDSTITELRARTAIAQFERAMISASSRWDTAYAAVYNATLPDKGLSLPLAGFTAQEERGRVLFMLAPPDGGLGCAGCHRPPTFALGPASGSNGLDAGETVVFKSPSLKSVSRARAFMHDGRFATLDQVVEHYNSGVQLGPALDNRLIAGNGQPRRLNLSVADKAALVAFLLTLDDTALAADPRFADPFKR